MDSFFLRFLYKSLYGTNYIFNEGRIIMGNELIKRINDVKCEIKKLENELRKLEREHVQFYAVVMQSHDDDVICDYGQVSCGAISEADAKKLILDDYWNSSCIYKYNIGYIPVSKEIYQKIGDLTLLKATRKYIDRCKTKINGFRDFDDLHVFNQQLDKTIEKMNCEINAVVDISDVTFVDFDD